MKVDKYSISGKVVGQVELPEALFGVDVNDILIYELIKAANANLRQGTHSTKVRDEVSGGGIKPWKQKGTGRARQGSIRAPQWRGGGIVFGPKPRDYSVDLPKEMKRAAYRSLFSLKAKDGSIKIVEDFTLSGKTKEAAGITKALKLTKAVLISENDDALIKRAVKNLESMVYNNAKRVSGRDIFYSRQILITESALKVLSDIFVKGGSK